MSLDGHAGAPERARALAMLLGFEFVDLAEDDLDADRCCELPAQVAKDACAVPVRVPSGPAIALGVPTDTSAIDCVRRAVGEQTTIIAAERSKVGSLIERAYPETASAESHLALLGIEPQDESEPQGPALISILLAWNVIRPDQAAHALREQLETGRSLAEIIAAEHWASEGELISALSEETGLEVVDLDDLVVDEERVRLLAEGLCRSHHLACIGVDGGRALVAISNPNDLLALDDARSQLGGDLELVLCPESQIDELLDRCFRRRNDPSAALRTVTEEPAALRIEARAELDDAPVVQFVNALLSQALEERASDVHLEPTPGELNVRFRVDGVLHNVATAPKAIERAVTTRIKVMANLDIAEHRVPQDGRMTLPAGARTVDVRVATLPTIDGEKVVMRLLDRASAPLELDRLGFLPDVRERYEAAFRSPSGTVLVAGPTGSGKSTTLYATLNQLNSPERNLITVEDPAEYRLPGINQVQVNPKAGLHFANALRAILRSDPDVLLVGEIRDRETATIAVEAALTGHLVLSCLHTSDAASTPARLIEMGVEPFLVGSALDCVLAQRLARVLCPSCSQPYSPSREELAAAGYSDELHEICADERFRRGVGCRACRGTGYRGRIAIQEVMPMSEHIERAVLGRAHSEEIRAIAIAEGMRPMLVDGLRKAAAGLTSLEEILRVAA